MTSNETWQPIPGFTGYEASDLGRVRSWRPCNRAARPPTTPRIVKGVAQRGYHSVSVSSAPGCKRKKIKVCRLVLLSFRGSCPEGMEACHNNGDNGDDRLTNIRWDTHQSNCADKERHGTVMRGAANGMAILDEQKVDQALRMLAEKKPQIEVGRALGVSRSTIGNIVYGSAWKHLTSSREI